MVIESNPDQRDLLGIQLRAAGAEPLLYAQLVEGIALARALLARQQPAAPALAIVIDQALDPQMAATLLPPEAGHGPGAFTGWTAGLALRAAMVEGAIYPCPIIGISDSPELAQPYLEHGGFTAVWTKPLVQEQIHHLTQLALTAAAQAHPHIHPAELTPIGQVVRRMVRDLYQYVVMHAVSAQERPTPRRTQAMVVHIGADRTDDPAPAPARGGFPAYPARVPWTREDAEILLAMFTKRARKERFAHGIPHILERVGDYGAARMLLQACANESGLEKSERDILLLILEGYDIKAIARLIAYSREWVTREIIPRIAERVAVYLNARTTA